MGVVQEEDLMLHARCLMKCQKKYSITKDRVLIEAIGWFDFVPPNALINNYMINDKNDSD